MIKVLITGAGSYVGESVRRYILSTSKDFEMDAVDTINDMRSTSNRRLFNYKWPQNAKFFTKNPG